MQQNLLKQHYLSKFSKKVCGLLAIIFLSAGIAFAATGKDFLKNNMPPVTITGRVVDKSSGESLVGVSIIVKNTKTGSITDVNGNFTITAPSDATLVASYIGYDSIEVPVAGQTSITIKLAISAKNLNEVIVVGYGTQQKTATTEAVSTIDTKEVAEKPVVNLSNSLVGRASGLIITQGSGEPGFDGATINIRGIGSIGGSAPLVIVDGVPRDFTRLDPNTVDNISVLKDAAAVAVYGVAGANGVILVTTKQGKKGTPNLTYNGYVGFQNPTEKPEFVSGYQYALMRNQAQTNDNLLFTTPQPLPYNAAQLTAFENQTQPDLYGNGHPLDQIIKKNTLVTYHNLTLSGGNENVKYFASVGYTHQDGMWSTTFLDKYNGSFNLTANATKTTTVALSINGWVEDQNFPSQSAGTIIGQAERQAPYTPVFYTNGLWTGYIGQSLIGEIYHSGYQLNENPTTNTQISIDQKLPLSGLSIKAVVSYDDNNTLDRVWTTPIPFYNLIPGTSPEQFAQGTQGSPLPQFNESYSQNHAFDYQGILNYIKSFGKSDVGFTAVVDERITKYETFGAARVNYNLNIDELNYGSPNPTDITNSGYSSGTKQLGYVYRANYSYDKKYLFEASGRYDGSYLFAPGKRFGFFPAFSAGWRISEEKFVKDNFTWINNLKLRASWGQSGAYPVSGGVIQTYQYLSPYLAYSPAGYLGGANTQGVYESLQGNPNITWEKANKADIGLESTLWNGILGFDIDYFYEKRSNMLVGIGNVLPGEYGIGTGLVNGGIMSNHGIDITLKSGYKFSNTMRLDVTGTFTYAKNKLLQIFENSATYNNPNRRLTGRPLNEQFGLQAVGYYTAADFVNGISGALKPGEPTPSFGTNLEPGDLKYADLNHDGKIDQNDITAIGNPQTPQIIWGLEPRLTYKSFDVDLLFQGTANSSIYLNGVFVQPFQASGSATELSFSQSWTPQNTGALYPRLSGTPTVNNTQESSWWLRNDAFIRLKSAELGYSLPNSLLHNKIKSVRLYVAGQNLFTWLPYMKETIDPDQNGGNSNYFQQRVISVGANVSF